MRAEGIPLMFCLKLGHFKSHETSRAIISFAYLIWDYFDSNTKNFDRIISLLLYVVKNMHKNS